MGGVTIVLAHFVRFISVIISCLVERSCPSCKWTMNEASTFRSVLVWLCLSILTRRESANASLLLSSVVSQRTTSFNRDSSGITVDITSPSGTLKQSRSYVVQKVSNPSDVLSSTDQPTLTLKPSATGLPPAQSSFSAVSRAGANGHVASTSSIVSISSIPTVTPSVVRKPTAEVSRTPAGILPSGNVAETTTGGSVSSLAGSILAASPGLGPTMPSPTTVERPVRTSSTSLAAHASLNLNVTSRVGSLQLEPSTYFLPDIGASQLTLDIDSQATAAFVMWSTVDVVEEPATTVGAKVSATPTVPLPVLLVITVEQLEQAVTVRYSGIFEQQWMAEKIDEFKYLVFDLLYDRCGCGLTR